MSNLVVLFNYKELTEQNQAFVQEKTEQIKALMTRTVNDIIDIGQSLIDVKERLEHGQFGAWLETEFEMTPRTARNFMNVASTFKSETVSDLKIATSALYLLANAPDEARDAAIEAAQAGERVTKAKAKAIINEHKPKPAPPTQPQTIASAPLAKAPKKPENQARCKNAECDGFGIEWSRSDRYGVGLYCLDCIKVNKIAERALLEGLKSGEIEEAFVLVQLGCSKQTLKDKMDNAFGAGWDKPNLAPTRSLTPPAAKPTLTPPVAKPTLTPPVAKPTLIPSFKLVLKVSPTTGRITVSVGEDGSGPAIWNTGKFEDVQMLLSGSLAEFMKKQGNKYDRTALYL